MKYLEYIVIGLSGISVITSVLLFLLTPFIILTWFIWVYVAPQWTDISTFTVLIIAGAVSLAFLLDRK